MKLRIEKAIYGGDGLARVPPEDGAAGGKTVFVPADAARRIGGGRASPRTAAASPPAELNAILEPSPERVVPGCEYVPRCGGCQYQHASAACQLQMKLDILKETLARAHLPVPGKSAAWPARPGAIATGSACM